MAATLTIVTPAAGTDAPPGTVSRKLNAPAVPTHASPSQAPMERSTSVSDFHNSRSSDASGTPPKARISVSYQVFHSSCRNVRSSTRPGSLALSFAMNHAYQGIEGGAREFRVGGGTTAFGEVHCEVEPRTGDKWDLPCQAAGPMDRVPN